MASNQDGISHDTEISGLTTDPISSMTVVPSTPRKPGKKPNPEDSLQTNMDSITYDVSMGKPNSEEMFDVHFKETKACIKEITKLKGDAEESIITINIDCVMKILLPIVMVQFLENRVLASDINIYLTEAGRLPTTMTELLNSGACLFDAVVFFLFQAKVDIKLFSLHNWNRDRAQWFSLAKSRLDLAAAGVYIVLRGDYPTVAENTIAHMPNFIKSVMGYDKSPDAMAKRLASFPVSRISKAWVKALDWTKVDVKYRTRFSLGVAGYRIIKSIMNLELKDASDQLAKDVRQVIKILVDSAPNFNWMSSTRAVGLVALMGPINDNLGNLMLHCFTKEVLEKAVKDKLIFKVPVLKQGVNDWKTWHDKKDLIAAFMITGAMFPKEADRTRAGIVKGKRDQSHAESRSADLAGEDVALEEEKEIAEEDV